MSTRRAGLQSSRTASTCAAFAPSTAPTDPGTILFFGAINYFPNADGVTFFIDEVLPTIRRPPT